MAVKGKKSCAVGSNLDVVVVASAEFVFASPSPSRSPPPAPPSPSPSLSPSLSAALSAEAINNKTTLF